MPRLIDARGLSRVYGSRGGVQVRAVDNVSLAAPARPGGGVTG